MKRTTHMLMAIGFTALYACLAYGLLFVVVNHFEWVLWATLAAAAMMIGGMLLVTALSTADYFNKKLWRDK